MEKGEKKKKKENNNNNKSLPVIKGKPDFCLLLV